jgi:hypothetical protein
MNKALIQTAFGFAFGSAAFIAHAATPYYGDVLTINPGITAGYDAMGNYLGVTGGSWFALDVDMDHGISNIEKAALSQGTTGLVIGLTTSPGASHMGAPTAGDTNAIDASWLFYGNTGSDYTTVGITGSTAAGLDMSGWVWRYAGGPDVAMSTGAWTPLNAAATGMQAAGYGNGIGLFSWDGVYGHAYTLDYTATVATSHPSGFGDVKYALHLEGVVAVPEASTWGMMLAGIGLVGLAVRRRGRAD